MEPLYNVSGPDNLILSTTDENFPVTCIVVWGVSDGGVSVSVSGVVVHGRRVFVSKFAQVKAFHESCDARFPKRNNDEPGRCGENNIT